METSSCQNSDFSQKWKYCIKYKDFIRICHQKYSKMIFSKAISLKSLFFFQRCSSAALSIPLSHVPCLPPLSMWIYTNSFGRPNQTGKHGETEKLISPDDQTWIRRKVVLCFCKFSGGGNQQNKWASTEVSNRVDSSDTSKWKIISMHHFFTRFYGAASILENQIQNPDWKIKTHSKLPPPKKKVDPSWCLSPIPSWWSWHQYIVYLGANSWIGSISDDQS